jgi:hypothetical protein
MHLVPCAMLQMCHACFEIAKDRKDGGVCSTISLWPISKWHEVLYTHRLGSICPCFWMVTFILYVGWEIKDKIHRNGLLLEVVNMAGHARDITVVRRMTLTYVLWFLTLICINFIRNWLTFGALEELYWLRKTKEQKNLSLCHFVHHKSDTD